MNDMHDLHDAFGELERQADTVTARTAPDEYTHRDHQGRRTRPVLVAATVVAVAGAAAVGTVIARSGGPSAPNQAGGSSPSATSITSSTISSPPAAHGFQIPTTSAELARELRAVLGATASITVIPDDSNSTGGGPIVVNGSPSQPIANSHSVDPGAENGAAIRGVLTTADGRSGGYDFQIFQSSPGKPICDDPDINVCTTRRLADGGWALTGHEPLQGGGVTYEADVIRADGVEFLMHLSSASDPKGDSQLLGATPPMTRQQMVDIEVSSKW